MDRNVKAFILASLVWLVAGATFGTLLAFGASAGYVAFRFAHMHLLLLGFMAMMVYGVGYFILPRFNGTTLRWPWMVDLHFWIANGGLVGLVFADPRFRPFFAVISLTGVVLFALNLIVTLLAAPSAAARLATKLPAQESGPAEGVAPAAAAPAASGTRPALSGEETIGAMLETYPQLEDTVRQFFGDGCFSCPGQSTETVIQAAMVHNIDPELLLEELRRKL